MINQHPITPSPELVRQWQQEANHNEPMFPQVANQAAQWGADKELNACCEWMFREPIIHEIVGRDGRYLDFELRAARRPQPPTLKAQALEQLMDCEVHYTIELSIIRRALEELSND